MGDALTTPGSPSTKPEIGRGGHLRNAKGQALVIPPGGGRHRIAIGGSDLDAFAGVYDGPPIYGDQGTHIHTITEWADAGRPVDAELIAAGEAVELDAATTHHAYDSYVEFVGGLGWATLLAECPVVVDAWPTPIASNIDKVMERGDGARVVVDVKSSNKVAKRAYVMQLAAYTMASIYDPMTGERSPLDVVDRVAYIFHFPLRDNREWQLIEVDVAGAGRPLLDRFMALRHDDSHLDAFTKIATPTPSPSVVESPNGDAVTHGNAAASPLPSLADLKATANAMSPADRVKVRELMGDTKPDDDLKAFAAAIAKVEGFGDIATTPAPPRLVVEQPAVLAEPDEGDGVSDAAVDAVRVRHGKLDAAAKTWVATVAAEAAAAGLDIGMSANGGRRTQRRLRIMSALVVLADGLDNPDAVRGCVAALGADHAAVADSLGFTLGQVVGHLGADDAARFDEFAHALAGGKASMRFTPAARVEVAA